MIWYGRLIKSIRRQAANWLQLVLVTSTLLFVYAPFLDHMLGFGAESRPHVHTTFVTPNRPWLEDSHDEHEEHESDYLCSLNLDAVLGLLLGFHLAAAPAISVEQPTMRLQLPACMTIDEIVLATIDPPPNRF